MPLPLGSHISKFIALVVSGTVSGPEEAFVFPGADEAGRKPSKAGFANFYDHKKAAAEIKHRKHFKRRRFSVYIQQGHHEQPLLDVSPIASQPKSSKGFKAIVLNDISGLNEVFYQWVNLLLLLLPAALGPWELTATWTFWVNLLLLVPLSTLLADATEQISIGTGSETLGALLNASLGNATEMIVTITALQAGLFDILKGAMLGSILNNMLMVLGCALFTAGFKYPELTFGVNEPIFNVSLLLLASMTFCLPTAFFSLHHVEGEKVVHISRACSVVTAFTYVAYVYFQIRPKEAQDPDSSESERDPRDRSDSSDRSAKANGKVASPPAQDQQPLFSLGTAFALLVALAALLSIISDSLVGAIQEFTSQSGFTTNFVGVIVLPIAGNVQSATTSMILARRGGTKLAVALALESCVQVALLVLPFAVLAGWILDKPMDLQFDILEVFILLLSVLVAFSIVVDGRVFWLHGLLLLSAYSTITIMFWYT